MPNWVILPYQGEERVAVSWPAGIERSRGLCRRVVVGLPRGCGLDQLWPAPMLKCPKIVDQSILSLTTDFWLLVDRGGIEGPSAEIGVSIFEITRFQNGTMEL